MVDVWIISFINHPNHGRRVKGNYYILSSNSLNQHNVFIRYGTNTSVLVLKIFRSASRCLEVHLHLFLFLCSSCLLTTFSSTIKHLYLVSAHNLFTFLILCLSTLFMPNNNVQCTCKTF